MLPSRLVSGEADNPLGIRWTRRMILLLRSDVIIHEMSVVPLPSCFALQMDTSATRVSISTMKL